MKLQVYKVRAYIEVEAPPKFEGILAEMTDDMLKSMLPADDITTPDGTVVRFVGSMVTEVETTTMTVDYEPPEAA